MKRKWYRKKRYVILSLLIFPPLGILLTWLTKWPRNVKIAATTASTLLFIAALAAPDETATVKADNPGITEPQESLYTPESETEQPVEPYLNIAELVGQPMTKLSEMFSTSLNEAGNLVHENEIYRLTVEARDRQTSSYVMFGVKELGSCEVDSVLDYADQVFSRAGLDPSIKGSPTNPQSGIDLGFVEYDNYPGVHEIGVSCLEGGYYEANIKLKD